MSLISDALRKARREAAEREAEERGLGSPMVAGYWRRGGHLATGLLIGAAIAASAAVIGGGVVWWVLLDRHGSASIEGPDGEGQALMALGEALSEQSAGEVAPGRSDDEPLTDVPAQSTVAIEDGAIISAGDETTDTVAADKGPAEGGEAPAGAADSPTRDSGKVYSGESPAEARIGDVTLTLDYLLYRAENPFAQINGRDVRVGSVIENFVVEEITADSVVLTRDETKVVLRVR